MTSIQAKYNDLSQPARRATFLTQLNVKARFLTLDNCTLDPCIFDFCTITDLLISNCIMPLSLWTGKNQIFPSLTGVAFVSCPLPKIPWSTIFAQFSPTITNIILDSVKGDVSTICWSRFPLLTNLSCNDLPFSFKKNCAMPPSLVNLSLTACSLRASDLSSIATLTTLTYLTLDHNVLTTTTRDRTYSLADLSPLTSLVSLSLANCTIKEWCGINLSYALRGMNLLKYLYLRENVGLRITGLTFIMNALLDCNPRTIDIEHKYLERFSRIRINYSHWTDIDAPTREWLKDHCKKRGNCVEKNASGIVCHECHVIRDKHERTCRTCSKDAPCEERTAMRCTHVQHCDICLTDFDETTQIIEIACHHFFCKSCMFEWTRANNSCPTCRMKLVLN